MADLLKECTKCPFCILTDADWECLVDGTHADFDSTCRPTECPMVIEMIDDAPTVIDASGDGEQDG